MVVQIGFVGQRSDLALEVASLASRAGVPVLALSLAPDAVAPVAAGVQVDLLLVDVASAAAARPGRGADGLVDPGEGYRIRPEHPPTVVGLGARADPSVEGRAPVVVVCRAGEGTWARDVAAARGFSHVVELPLGAPWLLSQVSPERGSPLLGVVGAVGGVGATTVAIACAVGSGTDCLLVDADPDSPGLDLPLGIREGAGVRWSGIPDTSEPLDPESLRAALPTVEGVHVVTGSGLDHATPGSRVGSAGGSGRVPAVLGVGRVDFGRTVVDVGRGGPPAGLLGPDDAVALVLPATLAGVVAGRRVLDGMPDHQVVVLLRPTGWLPADEVAEQLGVPVVLEVPRLRRAAELADCGDLLSGRTGRALRSLGEQVWGQLR